jgi:hypothetical protein
MVAAVVLFLSAGIPSRTVTAATDSQARIIHFPVDRSLGKLMVRPMTVQEGADGSGPWSLYTGWEFFDQAQGEVTVPAGHQVSLLVWHADGWWDLSPLRQLRPDDLWQLQIHGSHTGGGKPGDSCMQYVAHLTGLGVLDLDRTNVTKAGIQHMLALKNLQHLSVPDLIDDASMVHVAQLSGLESLVLGQDRVTNAGLKHLARLEFLTELSLGGGRMTNDGLAYLAELPRLRRLRLWGKNFTDAGLAYLKKCRSLEYLDLRSLSQTTDAGLVHLARIPQLKDLNLHWSEGITNSGIVPLKQLPHLRALDITHSQVTDEGLRTIAGFRFLQRLSISRSGLTISGLKALNTLTSLTALDLDNVSQDNSGLDLSGLILLEDLMLSLKRVRVAGEMVNEPFREQDIAALGKLTGLRRLQLSHAGATDAALRCLTGLKRLERLSIGDDDLTDEGLASLVELPHLTSMTLSGRFTDEALESLQKMENLTILDLRGARLSPVALNRFQRTMPRLVSFKGYEIDYAVRPRPQRRGRRR